MADNKKIYTIEINGISQSIKQVDALKEALNGLDTKIKAMEASTINVSSKTNVSTPNGLSEEVALQRELNRLKDEGVKLDAKIEASQTEVYKKVEATKDLYKEAIADQKALAAQERLTANEYSNTMQGMKQNLADLKAVISTTDLGDSDQIKKMTENANELTNKLKKMEEAYGQFGRNVGNYASAAEGFKNIQITVGGVVREFESAREASKTLGNELKTMAINGEQGTKKFKELQKAVAMLNSDIKDATVSSKAMDELLDTMQSFAALGSVTQGFSALFGFDDKEIQQSIQKLVALQNVMQGIEKLNQQINSQEGIGGWIAKGNQAIDSFVEKLVGANKAQQTLNATTQAGATAAKSMAAAETAQAAATTTATVATKALSLALKTIGIGLIISAVATLITYWKDIYKWFTDTIPALKNLSKWFDKIRAVAVGVGTAIVNYMIQPLVTFGKIVNDIIHGNFSDIGKHLVEGFKKTFNVVENYQKGYHKEIERQQEVHNEKVREEQKKANEELLKDEEAKYGKSHKRTQEYLKKQMALTKKGSQEYKELQRQLWEDERQQREENNKKKTAAMKKQAAAEKKLIEDAEKEINALRMKIMDDGLNKKLMQLDEEKRQTLNKLKGSYTAYLEAERLYEKLRLKEIKDFLKEINETVVSETKKINENFISLDISKLEEQVNKIDQLLKINNYSAPTVKTIVSKNDYDALTQGIDKERLKEAKELLDTYTEYTKLEQENIETFYKKELALIRSYGYLEEGTLEESFMKRLRDQRAYQTKSYENLHASLVDRRELLRKQAVKELELENERAERELEEQHKNLQKRADQIKEGMLAISNAYGGDLSKMSDEDKKSYDEMEKNLTEVLAQMQDRYDQYLAKVELNKKNSDQRLNEIDLETAEKMSENQEKYFNTQISNFRDFNSKMSQEVSKQPIYDKAGFGIINLSATKENYKEIQKAAKTALEEIKREKEALSDSFRNGMIKPEAYNAALTQLDDLEKSAKESLESISRDMEELGGKWWGSINQWIQQVGQTVNSVLSSLSEITDNHYEKEIEKQQEYIDKYEEQLNKQKDITQQYADEVDNIESELSNARGDRREHLIDQLNAEMAAQRASLAQEKKIEKERQKALDKQKKLEHDQAVAKKKMQLAQAAINTAMAISMAAVNSWPIPAIPMMALAAAAGAAQIAAISSQNIPSYGSGGVIEGKSHSQGGVKVLGGRAEVEGGEFITNKVTTSKNVDLLEYINGKRKKINLEDLIEFYGTPVRKNIQTVRTKFADGGIVPTLRNDINISDRMLTAFEDYSNRPVQVAVVDIIDRTQQVNDVKVMAGIDA